MLISQILNSYLVYCDKTKKMRYLKLCENKKEERNRIGIKLVSAILKKKKSISLLKLNKIRLEHKIE